MSYNIGVRGPGAYYHDAPENIPHDNSHHAPEAFPYIAPYQVNKKPLDTVNPKIMKVGLGSRRQLGEMSASKFWIIPGVVCALVIAATVGEAVGGSLAARKDRGGSGASSSSSSTATATSVSSAPSPSSSSAISSKSTTSTATSPTPSSTFPPPSLSCTNGTTYNSPFLTGENSTPPPGAGLIFTRLCGYEANINNIGSAFVYSLDDCIEICAGIKFWPGDRRCRSVFYRPEGKGKPVNCEG